MVTPVQRRALRAMRGLITVAQGEALSSFAGNVRAGEAIVELGSHSGLSTCWMAAGATGAHVFAVDPWGPPRPGSDDDPLGLGDDPYPTFRANVEAMDLGSRITALRAKSTDVAPWWCKPVGLLFIDAVHEEWAVRADVAAWEPHMAPGGYLALHDYEEDPAHPYHGVAVVARELEARGWREAFREGSLWVAVR